MLKHAQKILAVFILSISLIEVYAQSEQSSLMNTLTEFNDKGLHFITIGKFDSAEYYYNKTLQIKETRFGTKSLRAAYTHVNLASIYRKLYNFSKALYHLNIAEEIILEEYPNSKFLGYVYHNKGNIYYMFDDLNETLRYYEFAMNHIRNASNSKIEDIIKGTRNYFLLLTEIGDYERAYEILTFLENKSIDPNPRSSISYHIFMAKAYHLLDEQDKAFIECRKSKKIVSRHDFDDELLLINNINQTLAEIYLAKGEYLNAKKTLHDNVDIYLHQDYISINKKLNTYLLLSTVEYKLGNYQTSISTINTALEVFNDFLEKRNLLDNKNIAKNYSSNYTKFYVLKSRALNAQYNNSSKNIEDLYEAMETYDYSIDLLNTSKLKMVNEESKFLAVEDHLDAYHEAIKLALNVYRETGEEEYLEKAFRYAESSKSFALLSEINKTEVMEFAGLPREVKNKEERLSREISAYEELLLNEEMMEHPDTMKLKNFKDKLFSLRDDYNNLLYEIENNYPNYYELKYNPHFITIGEIQKKIGHEEAVVEYVLSDSLLTMFIIEKDQVDIIHQPVDSSFSRECIEYYTMIHKQDFSKEVHNTYRRYVELGRKFHETLVQPVLETIDQRTITFVPDGAIMYLPFESFLTENCDSEYINYMDLPYLIHDLSIGYTYSSTLMFNRRASDQSPKEEVLAFAPTYDNLLNDVDPLVWNRQANPDFLIPLKGVKEEVNRISQLVPSNVYMGHEATENNFKKQASNYSIIHLAMHTIMNDENPMYSRLAFTRTENDSAEDNDLFTYEIYNMKLNARMVVLSSCSSGYGKMLKGEGMMSLARGFFYAGCPSIIMTLWQVSDRSSAELMGYFYKYLKRGRSKHEALRLAKIDYIKKSDGLKSNPYFWSGFVCVGDNSPVYTRSGLVYWVIIVVLFTGLIVFTQVRSYRRRKR